MTRWGMTPVEKKGGRVAWRGICPKCKREGWVQWAHIVPISAASALRWDPDNALPLCARDHLFWWHKFPTAVAVWVRELLGDAAIDRLEFKAKATTGSPQYEIRRLALLQDVARAQAANTEV